MTTATGKYIFYFDWRSSCANSNRLTGSDAAPSTFSRTRIVRQYNCGLGHRTFFRPDPISYMNRKLVQGGSNANNHQRIPIDPS